MNDLKNILESIATPENVDFFGLGAKLKKLGIESSYSNYSYLIIKYSGKKYCLTSCQNAKKEDNDIIIFNNFILGLNN